MTALHIDLPEGFTPLVHVNDIIHAEHVLARKLASQEFTVNIPQMLNIQLKHVKNVLKKNPGDTVFPNDIIAEKKGGFGKKKKTIVCHLQGTVARYDRMTGDLTIATNDMEEKGKLKSPVAGVIGLCNNKEIVINTEDAIVSDGVAIGVSTAGRLFTLQESFVASEQGNGLYYLDTRCVGKIVLLNKLTRDMYSKGISIGVKGFLAVEIDNEDIEYFSEKEQTLGTLEVTKSQAQELVAWERKPIKIDIAMKAVFNTTL